MQREVGTAFFELVKDIEFLCDRCKFMGWWPSEAVHGARLCEHLTESLDECHMNDARWLLCEECVRAEGSCSKCGERDCHYEVVL